MFVEEFKRKPGTIWIMKPAGRSQGKGIFLFTDLKDIMEWKKVCRFRDYWDSSIYLCEKLKIRSIIRAKAKQTRDRVIKTKKYRHPKST